MKSYSICLSLSDLFHLTKYPGGYSIHVAAKGKISFFFMPSSIPLYVYATSPLFIHLLMDTGCFHNLETVNNVSMNIGVHDSFQN